MKPKKKDKKTKEIILDAAEKMFAEKGFYGASTRDITEEAGVPLGLMGYYFKTKRDLYVEVIARRADEHVTCIQTSMRAAQAGGNGEPVSLAKLIDAYFRPIVERSLNGGPGWKNYIRLLSRAANTRRSEPYVKNFMQTYNPIGTEFVAILKDRFPDTPEQDIYWCYYFLSSAIIHVLTESEAIDKLSGGVCKSSDFETILEKMGPFFEAGISQLALGKPSAP